jgi:hypothetical protein
LAQQKRKCGVFDDPIERVLPHDMRHLMAEHESDFVPLPLEHFQQRPAHENRPARKGKRIRLPLRCNPDNEGNLLLLYIPRQPAPNLGRKSGGLILHDQGDTFHQSCRQVAAQTYFGPQRVFLRPAYEDEDVLGLRGFVAERVSNRFKKCFRHGTSPGELRGCSGKVEKAGDDGRPFNRPRIHAHHRCIRLHRGANRFTDDAVGGIKAPVVAWLESGDHLNPRKQRTSRSGARRAWLSLAIIPSEHKMLVF